MKQMKLAYGGGYTPDELAAFRLVVYENLVDSANNLVLTVQKIGVEDINRVRSCPCCITPAKTDERSRLNSSLIFSFISDGLRFKEPHTTATCISEICSANSCIPSRLRLVISPRTRHCQRYRLFMERPSHFYRRRAVFRLPPPRFSRLFLLAGA